jgi:hypothetical protein
VFFTKKTQVSLPPQKKPFPFGKGLPILSLALLTRRKIAFLTRNASARATQRRRNFSKGVIQAFTAASKTF